LRLPGSWAVGAAFAQRGRIGKDAQRRRAVCAVADATPRTSGYAYGFQRSTIPARWAARCCRAYCVVRIAACGKVILLSAIPGFSAVASDCD